jgi:hypothetical protein
VKNTTTTPTVPQENYFDASPERFFLNLYAACDGEDWRIDGMQNCLEEFERLGFIRILMMSCREAVVDVYEASELEFFRSFVMGNA